MLLSPPALAAPPEARFWLLDRADPREIAEATDLYVNGVKIAHFELDSKRQSIELSLGVPRASRYEYALCGHIVIRTPDGGAETHAVDGGGVLDTLDGRHLTALAAANFTIFYLAETGEQSPPPAGRTSQVCQAPEV